MANTKEYQIKINGLSESINAVESLNKQLDNLEQKMKTISSSKVSAGGGSSASRGSNSALSEEERVQKEINKLKEQGQQLDAKIAASQDEIYRKVDATKELYKATIADQKALAAQERLTANAYSNTMVGMKQQLADLKAVIQTTDMGDADGIKKMTEQANVLTEKLKKMEEAYGQFGRNVGNYASAADGFKKLEIEVNGVTRTFDNAKQALKALKTERDTMALTGDRTTDQFKELDETVKRLQSDINDLSKSSATMDNLLDTMESFTALASMSQGISALFGIDDTEIQKSIQKLVALQNVLKGIETINKQIKTGEGIGGWIKPFIVQVDLGTAKLLKFNTALLGTGTASKIAAKGIKGLGLAIKGLASLGLLIVFDLLVEGVTKLIEKFKESDKELEKQKQYIENTQGAYAKASAEIQAYNAKLQSFNGTQKQENALVEELNNKFGKQLGTYKTLAQWKDVLSKKGEAYAKTMLKEAEAQALLNMYTEAYIELQKVQAAVAAGEYHHWYQTVAGDREADAKAIADATKKVTEAEEAYQKKMKEIENFNKDNKLMNYAPQIKKDGKKSVDAVKEVEKEMYAARLSLMKEGLNKTITQLEEERKQRIAKIRSMGKNFKQEEAEINRIYDTRILEAKEDWAKKMEKIYSDMWDKIYADSLDNAKRIAALTTSSIEVGRKGIEDSSNTWFNQNIGSYGIQGKKQLKPSTQFSLGIASVNNSQFMQDMKLEVDLMREAQAAQNEYLAALEYFNREKDKLSNAELGRLNFELDSLENNYKKRTKILEEYRDEMAKLYDQDNMEGAKQALFNENYGGDLSTVFNQRMSAVEAYWQKRISFETSAATAAYSAQKQVLDEQYSADTRAALAHWDEMQKISSDYYDKEVETIRTQEKNKLITHEEAEQELRGIEAQYNRDNIQIYKNYKTQEAAITEQYNTDLIRLNKEKNNKLKQTNAEYYQAALQELRDFQTAQSNLENKQPVKNAWGITNFKETNANYKNLLASYEQMANKIIEKRAQVNKDFNNGVIDKDTFESTIRELDNFSADLGEKMDNVKDKLNVGNQIGQFIQDIQPYVQALGQGLQQIMSAVWDYQDYMFEKEQDELDKWNEKLDKELDKQQEIVEEHKNNVDSIEDELATARGDRRQHLIDQLNAEITAQRAAQKEEQRIKKEQEAAKKKEEALEKKRREQEYKRNVMQAFISWHLAIANGLATQPFLPVGIAMGALATALGAVQYALVKSQKPYAKGGQLDGGVAQGARHRDGGIPVLGGRASIEGGEFITNRRTTAQNVDLLEFVNSKHRKLSIDDFIDFYSTTPRKVIRGVRTKFEDGGYLPTLPSTLDVKDQLQNIVINQDNRPIVVSVVDINNKQDQVRRVQTLAGL